MKNRYPSLVLSIESHSKRDLKHKGVRNYKKGNNIQVMGLRLYSFIVFLLILIKNLKFVVIYLIEDD